jgi:hypothetical protein
MKSFVPALLFPLMAAALAHLPPPPKQNLASNLVRIGLTGSDSAATENLCEHVSFTRDLRYSDTDANVLDVATSQTPSSTPRPVLLFVARDHFDDSADRAEQRASLEDHAMCFAVRNGMVGVRANFRPAPEARWPAGIKDVSAAVSWIHDEIDLFNGDPNEIVAIGYAAGAFHVASLLAHPEFQVTNSDLAGVVLVSGIYQADDDPSADEKSYLGSDPRRYDGRSAFPGILGIEQPIVLAWAANDPPRLVSQGENLKDKLCRAGHCPRTVILKNRNGLASALGLGNSDDGLAEPTLQLVRQLEARGLP